MDITFNNHGITATIDESVIDISAMNSADVLGENKATLFRNAVKDEVFPIETPAYTDQSNTTVFTIGCGTVTVPSELLTAANLTQAQAQEKLDNISNRLVARFPA